MNPNETAVAERLHAAAARIPVDVDLASVLDVVPARGPVRRSVRWRGPAGGIALAVAAAAAVVVLVAVRSTTGPDAEPTEGAVASTNDVPPGAVAPHVASPPDWYEPLGTVGEGGLRDGRWVSTAIGREVAPGDVRDPIAVSVYDGTYVMMSIDADEVVVDGVTFESRRVGGWEALATTTTPTVMVSGEVDRATLVAVLDAVEVTGSGAGFTFRLTGVPEGYTEVVAPVALGPDPDEHRGLGSDDAEVGIAEAAGWPDPLLVAAGAGVDITAVDVGGSTGWTGVGEVGDFGPVRFLMWSPRPGVVFELDVAGTDRGVDDLVELAEATTAIDAAEWDEIYDPEG